MLRYPICLFFIMTNMRVSEQLGMKAYICKERKKKRNTEKKCKIVTHFDSRIRITHSCLLLTYKPPQSRCLQERYKVSSRYIDKYVDSNWFEVLVRLEMVYMVWASLEANTRYHFEA